jgi:hypothetical protein
MPPAKKRTKDDLMAEATAVFVQNQALKKAAQRMAKAQAEADMAQEQFRGVVADAKKKKRKTNETTPDKKKNKPVVAVAREDHRRIVRGKTPVGAERPQKSIAPKQKTHQQELHFADTSSSEEEEDDEDDEELEAPPPQEQEQDGPSTKKRRVNAAVVAKQLAESGVLFGTRIVPPAAQPPTAASPLRRRPEPPRRQEEAMIRPPVVRFHPGRPPARPLQRPQQQHHQEGPALGVVRRHFRPTETAVPVALPPRRHQDVIPLPRREEAPVPPPPRGGGRIIVQHQPRLRPMVAAAAVEDFTDDDDDEVAELQPRLEVVVNAEQQQRSSWTFLMSRTIMGALAVVAVAVILARLVVVVPRIQHQVTVSTCAAWDEGD